MVSKSLSDLKTLDDAVEECLRRPDLPTRKEKIAFMCLWECCRLGLLPIDGESCFGVSVESLLRALENNRE